MTAPQAPATLWDRRWRLLLVGVVSVVTVVATEAMAISTIMPVVEDELGDLWLYGWAFSAFSLGEIIGIVLGGRAADRVPPVVPLMAGLGAFAVGLAVGGIAPAMAVLVLGRLLQGLGGGAVVAVAYVCVGRGFPDTLRPSVFAVMSTAWILPSLVSPLLASFVADSVGWRWVFLGLIPVTIAIGVLALRSVRTLRSVSTLRPDAPSDTAVEPVAVADRHRVGIDGGPVAAADGAPLLDESVETADGPDNSHVGEVIRLAGGATLVIAGLTTEVLWAVFPLVGAGLLVGVPPFRSLTPAGTMRVARGLPAAVGTRGVLTFAFFGADAFISLAVTSVRGTGTTFAGFVLAASSLTWTAGSWLQARKTEAWGARRLVRLGGGCLAVGLVGLALSLSDTVPLWGWVLASAICGFGMGTAYSPLSVVTLAEAEPGREGEATSALQLTDVLGVALGTGVAGAVVSLGDRMGSDEWIALACVFFGTALMAVLVTVLAGRLVRGSPPPATSSVI